jgi:hypothetical protein
VRGRDPTRAASPRLIVTVLVVVIASLGVAACHSQPQADRGRHASTTTGTTTLPIATTTTTTVVSTTVASSTTTSPPSPSTATSTTTRPATATTPTTVVSTGAGATVSLVTAADLPHSYRAGCPVTPAELRMLHLPYWGFDGRDHTGALVVAASVVSPVIGIFTRLHAAHFPIRSMRPVDDFGGDDNASMAADNTSAFNCRNAVASGPPRWSVHAYGEAIDVDPVENPYLEGGRVYPPSGAAFTDRSNVRPGMAEPGNPLNAAFAAYGWPWGGRWSASPDYQHFSATGG